MTKLRDMDAFGHPAYDSGVRYAAERAYRNPGDSFAVYWDGAAIFVRVCEAVKPPDSKLVCIAQQWSGNQIQLRFDGARSEWMYV